MADNNTQSADSSDAPQKDVFELSLETRKEIDSVAENTVPDDNNETQQESSATGSDAIDTDDESAETSVVVNPDDSTDVPVASKPAKASDITGQPIVVDASDHIAGRLSSLIAKLLLQGNRVSLVNCERIMISGTRSNTIHEYRQFLKINSIINPKHGPVHYRRPDTIITKMIRGMLPFEKKPSGRTAHKRLRAYVGSPRELKSFKKVQFEKAKIRRAASSYTTMGELCGVIGWTK